MSPPKSNHRPNSPRSRTTATTIADPRPQSRRATATVERRFWAEMWTLPLTQPAGPLPARVVLRLAPDAQAAARKTAVQAAVAAQGYPTPLIHASETANGDLRAWSVMDFATGQPLLAGLNGLRALTSLPRLATGLPDTLARAAVELHQLDPEPVEAELNTLVPRNHTTRQHVAGDPSRRPAPVQRPRQRRPTHRARLDRRPHRPPRLRPRLHPTPPRQPATPGAPTAPMSSSAPHRVDNSPSIHHTPSRPRSCDTSPMTAASPSESPAMRQRIELVRHRYTNRFEVHRDAASVIVEHGVANNCWSAPARRPRPPASDLHRDCRSARTWPRSR